ncbi:unnamed protein product [Caenorhabditis angaria]|uniref:Uncharacterized protein n=1 Tax=Caenorhabditis angaria TaxID=860376 RepID=A0A9P1IVN4_9PELO|nr:unnamed protein product [Caenorhabditis angaria]
MRVFFILIFLFTIFIGTTDCETKVAYSYGWIGDNVDLELGKSAQYRRLIGKVKQVYRVCNGKNAAKCGYWENIKTKKKVANASKTTFNSTGNILTIKKVTLKDAGTYWTNDVNDVTYLMVSEPGLLGK